MLPGSVVVSSNIESDLRDFFSKTAYSNIGVLTDENTLKYCYPLVASAIPSHFTITVKSGEEQKNLATCSQIWQAMTDHTLDRHSLLIILGGGVLGDMGGFCAATYKRGIDFLLVPTTLLAQADASIGGKLGIDFNHLKNHIGVFQLPVSTILFSGFLKTLPVGELRSGFAEVIKHTLISDLSMWNKVRAKGIAEQDWNLLVKHSAEFKSKVVTEDPREKGLRKILNAGHTIGHALESYLLANNNRVLHGEAIAAGLVMEGYISWQRKMITQQDLDQIKNYILEIFGKVNFNVNEEEAIATLALQDKKNKGNKILCVLFEQVGRARWDCEISLEEVKGALSFYRNVQM
jgi:3-dehydroquinate synthase